MNCHDLVMILMENQGHKDSGNTFDACLTNSHFFSDSLSLCLMLSLKICLINSKWSSLLLWIRISSIIERKASLFVMSAGSRSMYSIHFAGLLVSPISRTSYLNAGLPKYGEGLHIIILFAFFWAWCCGMHLSNLHMKEFLIWSCQGFEKYPSWGVMLWFCEQFWSLELWNLAFCCWGKLPCTKWPLHQQIGLEGVCVSLAMLGIVWTGSHLWCFLQLLYLSIVSLGFGGLGCFPWPLHFGCL